MAVSGSSIAQALSGSHMGGVALGAATLASENLTGISPLDFMPSPFTAPLWGSLMNPVKAARIINPFSGGTGAVFAGLSESVTSKWGEGSNFFRRTDAFKNTATYAGATYRGPVGFKTLMLGMRESSGLAAKMSIGNMALSSAELVGHAFANKGMGDALWVKTLQNARTLGVAGMLNIGEDLSSPEKLGAAWAYKFGGIDPSNVKAGKQISAKVADGGEKAIKHYLPQFSDDAVKAGFKLGAGMGARVFSTVAAGFSLYTYYDIISTVTSSLASTSIQGAGELAATLNQWIDEKRGLEFGYGRIPQAMISAGASTERRRAVQASYGAKINPRNRLMGNEASYHHNR